MTLQLLKLVVAQIKVAAPLPFNVRDEDGQLLLAVGQMVETQAHLEMLVERGLYVDREEIRALKERRAAAQAAAQPKSLFELWEQAIWRLERVFKSLIGRELDALHHVDEFAAQLTQLIQRDPDVGIFLSMRHEPPRFNIYGLTHSLHTALACHLIATRLGWPPEQTGPLFKAALTMNLSIYEMQGRYAAMGRVSEAQRAQIATHAEQSVVMLRAAGVTDEIWLDAVLQHHESVAATRTALSGVLRLADVFMAKISPRAERPALPIQTAARQAFSESQGSQAAAALIKEYGIYPPGDFVQLASGELAVVIRRGATATTPLVAAITNRDGVPVVSTNRRDTSLAGHAIVGPAADRKIALRVPPERLYGLMP